MSKITRFSTPRISKGQGSRKVEIGLVSEIDGTLICEKLYYVMMKTANFSHLTLKLNNPTPMRRCVHNDVITVLATLLHCNIPVQILPVSRKMSVIETFMFKVHMRR